MSNNLNTRKLSVILIFILCALVLMIGCGDPRKIDKYGYEELEGDYANAGDNVPPQKLAEGQILSIRLVYAINEKDELDDEWYKVELSKKDSKWKDMVMIQGIGRSKERHYDDYYFFSSNFNAQLNPAYGYNSQSLDGEYLITITNSSGYNRQEQINWADGGWTNADGAIMFSVP